MAVVAAKPSAGTNLVNTARVSRRRRGLVMCCVTLLVAALAYFSGELLLPPVAREGEKVGIVSSNMDGAQQSHRPHSGASSSAGTATELHHETSGEEQQQALAIDGSAPAAGSDVDAQDDSPGSDNATAGDAPAERPFELDAPRDTSDCYSSQIVADDGTFSGIMPCAIKSPRGDALFAALETDEAVAVLHGHCAPPGLGLQESQSRCGTYLKDFTLLKVWAPKWTTLRLRRGTLRRQIVIDDERFIATASHPELPIKNNVAYYAPWFAYVNSTYPERRVWPDYVAKTDGSEDSGTFGFSTSHSWIHGVLWEPARSLQLPAWGRNHEMATADYDVGFITPTLSGCLSNLFHGTFDYVLPVVHAVMAARALHPKATRFVFFVRVIPLKSMGNQNSRCPVMNHPPYGFGTPATTAFMLHALRRAFKRVDFVAYNEFWRKTLLNPQDTDPQRLKGQSQLHVNAYFKAEHLYRGLPTSCFPAHFETRSEYHPVEYPFVRPSPRCSKVLAALRSGVLDMYDVPERGPLTLAEARCPTVLIISRRLRTNARNILPWAEFVKDVTSVVHELSDGCGTVKEVIMESLSKKEQIDLLQTGAVFVGARGAGLVMGIFQRVGASTVSLSPSRRDFPALNDDSTLPWMPWGVPYEGRHTVISHCDATAEGFRQPMQVAMCRVSSANFCNLHCTTFQTRVAIRTAIAHIRRAAAEREAGGSGQQQHQTSYIVPTATRVEVNATVRQRVQQRVLEELSSVRNHDVNMRRLPVLTEGAMSFSHLLYLNTKSADMLDAVTRKELRYTDEQASSPKSAPVIEETGVVFPYRRISYAERMRSFANVSADGTELYFMGERAWAHARGRDWFEGKRAERMTSPPHVPPAPEKPTD